MARGTANIRPCIIHIAITPQDLAAKLPGARLQTFGAGQYAITAGADIVRNPDGSPYLLQVLP